MTDEKMNRRDAIKKTVNSGVALGAVASMPHWILPALAQGEELVPFTDMPEDFSRGPARPGGTHFLDTRMIDDFYTDNEDFYVVQHYGQPELDLDNYRLKVTGMVGQELELSLSDLQDMAQFEIDAGFECGGNRAALYHGLIGNARWRGVALRNILGEARILEGGEEVVFFWG